MANRGRGGFKFMMFVNWIVFITCLRLSSTTPPHIWHTQHIVNVRITRACSRSSGRKAINNLTLESFADRFKNETSSHIFENETRMNEERAGEVVTAKTVHVQLQLLSSVSGKCHITCKKFAKVFLSNRRIHLNQILEVSDFLCVRINSIEAAASSSTNRCNELPTAERYFVSSSTKIFFVRDESFVSDDRFDGTENNSVEIKHSAINGSGESDLPSRNQVLCPHGTHPQRGEVLLKLGRRMIAGKKFFNAVANAIVYAVPLSTKDCALTNAADARTHFLGNITNKLETSESSYSTAGIIVESDIGGGKSLLLQTIFEIYGHKRSRLVSCRNLVSKNR
jgi:hypothetical protein